MNEDPNELERLAKETEAAAAAPAGRPRQPVDKGHFGISIDIDGVWSHGGTPFPRPALARLFSTVMKRDADGAYWLETPVERGRIDVEDAPFVIVEMTAEGEGEGQAIKFRTNLDDWTALDADHPLRIETDAETEEPRPYVLIRPGLEARLLRPIFYELADLAVDAPNGEPVMGVWSHGAFHEIGPADDDE